MPRLPRFALLRAVASVLVRPQLWWVGLQMMRRTAPNRWWRRPPFLPLPSRQYLEFRLTTQYGGETPTELGRDLVAYLEWCRSWSRTD